MHRCDKSVGNYRVSLVVLHEKDPYHAQIPGHRDVMADVDGKRVCLEEAPYAGTDKPFEGELCAHELAWLTDSVPGRDYPMRYDWTVEKLPL